MLIIVQESWQTVFEDVNGSDESILIVPPVPGDGDRRIVFAPNKINNEVDIFRDDELLKHLDFKMENDNIYETPKNKDFIMLSGDIPPFQVQERIVTRQVIFQYSDPSIPDGVLPPMQVPADTPLGTKKRRYKLK